MQFHGNYYHNENLTCIFKNKLGHPLRGEEMKLVVNCQMENKTKQQKQN